MHNFLYWLTICLLHYYTGHVSSINMSIFRRNNCIHTTSGIFALELCERSYINIRSTVLLRQYWSKHKIWTTFTYHSPKIRRITNLFRNTNVGIAFKATTTLKQLLTPTTEAQTSQHEKSGIYKITCKIILYYDARSKKT